MLHFFHDEGGLEGGYVLMSAYNVEEELLIVLHVGRLYAQEIVEGAADVVALRHLWYLTNHLGKGVGMFAVKATKLDAAEHRKAFVQLSGIKDSCILFDEAKAFKALHALVGRSGGEVNLGCKLFVGETGILLQSTEYVRVFLVEAI